MSTPQQTVLDLLIAAWTDALREGKLTQLLVQLDPDGKGLGKVRMVIMPEKMAVTWPTYAPAGTPTKGN